MPWVTGAPRAAHFVTGAVLEDGRQVLLVVPRQTEGLVVGEPLPLMALQGSLTATVTCREVFVEPRYVLAGPAERVMEAGRSGTGGLETSCLALGLARAALDHLAREAQAVPSGTARPSGWRRPIASCATPFSTRPAMAAQQRLPHSCGRRPTLWYCGRRRWPWRRARARASCARIRRNAGYVRLISSWSGPARDLRSMPLSKRSYRRPHSRVANVSAAAVFILSGSRKRRGRVMTRIQLVAALSALALALPVGARRRSSMTLFSRPSSLPRGGVALTPGGKKLRLRSVNGGNVIRTFAGHEFDTYAVAFSADGRRLLAGDGSRLRLWEVASGKQALSLDGAGGNLSCLAISPDGRHAISGYSAGSGIEAVIPVDLYLWDLTTGKGVCRDRIVLHRWVLQGLFSPSYQLLPATTRTPPRDLR